LQSKMQGDERSQAIGIFDRHLGYYKTPYPKKITHDGKVTKALNFLPNINLA
jgi:hypothetical protein